MAMLNFKMGSWTKEFDNLSKVPGTVYVTTNEKAMYVDVDANTRIRIGDIIQVNSAKTAEPPFSTEALYYFIEENALMKWNGSEWKQLNKVSDIQTSIGNLQDDVNTLTSNVATNTTDIATNKSNIADNASAIAANKEAIESNDEDIAGLTDRMFDVESAANTNAGNIQSLTSDVNTLTSTSATHTGQISDLTSRVETLEDAVGDENDTNSILGRLKTDEANIKTNSDAIGTDTTEGTVKYRIKQLEKSVQTNTSTLADHDDAISALQEAIGTNSESGTLSARMKAVEDKNAEQDTAISAAQTQADKGVTDAATAQAAAEAAQSSANANTSNIATLMGDASVTNSVANQVAAEAKLRADADTSLQSQITAVKTQIGDSTSGLVKDIADNKAAAAAAQSDANANTAAIATLNGSAETSGSVAYAVAQAKAALSAEIDADINAANAMNYISNISGYNELPSVSSGVHVGDTYVVGTGFKNGSDVYNAGDMLIAGGTEDANGNITGTIIWNHVKTGYDASNEPSLVGASDKITLLSHLGSSLGDITFASAGTNEAGTVVTVTGNEVEIGIQWGTF